MKYPFLASNKGQIVASCRGSKKPLVFKCGEGLIADLETLPVECKLNCVRADKAAYADDDTKYYECVYNGQRWESKLKSCFKNYYFNASLKQCVVAPITTTIAPATTLIVSTTTASDTTTIETSTTVESTTTL